MGFDSLSPVVPARVKVLTLPLGNVKRSRFVGFVERLQHENVVPLGDISPDKRPNRTMFSPQGRSGAILFDLSTSFPSQSHLSLAPFELFREPLIVVGICDALDITDLRSGEDNGPEIHVSNQTIADLSHHAEAMRDLYPRALVHHCLAFDLTESVALPEGFTIVPPVSLSTTTTIKTVLCDLASYMLAEMTTYAKSLQALPTIESPRAPEGFGLTGSRAEPPTDLSRHNSQLSVGSQNSRTGSPSDYDRTQHRMSMPAQLPSTSSAASSISPGMAGMSRPGPRNGTRTPPPTTFEEIAGNTVSPSEAPKKSNLTRSSAALGGREHSRERVSVSGFGSGSLSERARNKGKGRVGVIIGTLYMLAGRWSDGLKEFVDSATVGEANRDHIWHGKALENILVCQLMLAWNRQEFEIPSICYPNPEKASASSRPSSHTPSNSQSSINGSAKASESARVTTLRNLSLLIPDFATMILNYYTRASNYGGEALPQLAFSESVLRISRLLVILRCSNGQLGDETLRLIVTNAESTRALDLRRIAISIQPTRMEILRVVLRSYPSDVSSLSVTDRITILAGIATILSSLHLHRKKAFFVRELIETLVPALVQARKVGAAEMGVHPAAGLVSSTPISGVHTETGTLNMRTDDVESGIGTLMTALGQVYGIVGSSNPSNYDFSNDGIAMKVSQNAKTQAFGNKVLKIGILRMCINLCEALPDFKGVLRCTTELLQTAKAEPLKSYEQEVVSMLSREEQVRLATNISRTVSASRRLKLRGIEADYWDEFIVRAIELSQLPPWQRPVPHAKKELEELGALEEQKEKSLFIYNPFLKVNDFVAGDECLVAGEQIAFRVVLQNPFAFELELDYVRLEHEGVEFESNEQGAVLLPYRSQALIISGVPKTAGMLRIVGCVIKIRGCRKRRFPVFRDSWYLDVGPKIKTIGLEDSEPLKGRPISNASTSSRNALEQAKGPSASNLELTVINEQPTVIVKATSLSQAAMMVLEGEVKAFTMTLQNLSKSAPADLLLFSFQDSTSAPLQAAMSNKNNSTSELYELELMLTQRQAFRRRPKENESIYIGPGQSSTFEIEVLGKPGLTNGVVQVDYACLGVPKAEIRGQFYTRKLVLPVSITVNASVEVLRADCTPFHMSLDRKSSDSDESAIIPEKAAKTARNASPNRDFSSLFTYLEKARDYPGVFLLLLDLRNAWPDPLTVKLQIGQDDGDNTSQTTGENATLDNSWTSTYTIDEILHPGHTTRMIMPVPCIFLPNPQQPIPSLNPATKRQFVVSAGKGNPEIERTMRENFWYKEEILKRIRASWHDTQGHTGAVELRAIRLTPKMIEAVKVEDVGISNTVTSDELFRQVGRYKFEVLTDSYISVFTRIHNRMTRPLCPLLRLQPSLHNQPHNIALDTSKCIAWNGLLQRVLPVLGPGETTVVETSFCILCHGEYEFGASVEEVKVWSFPKDEVVKKSNQDASAPDSLCAIEERRIWHAREGCIVFSKDRVDDFIENDEASLPE